MNWRIFATGFLVLFTVVLFESAFAQDTATPAAPPPAPTASVPQSAPASAPTAAPPASSTDLPDLTPATTGPGGLGKVSNKLSLMEMIQHGGGVMYVLIALGFLTLVLSIYLFLTLTPNREVPPNLVKRAQSQIRAGDIRGAYQMCLERDELIAAVLRSGLKMAGHDRYVIQEAMESEGERGATAMWQRVSYLNSIGNIAPLLGLLGTVWGMIGAFGAIALDTSQVRGVTMAYYVSMAMVCTAGGLIVAIPALGAYYYLRGRVVRIIAVVEAQASEFVELIVEHGGK